MKCSQLMRLGRHSKQLPPLPNIEPQNTTPRPTASQQGLIKAIALDKTISDNATDEIVKSLSHKQTDIDDRTHQMRRHSVGLSGHFKFQK